MSAATRVRNWARLTFDREHSTMGRRDRERAWRKLEPQERKARLSAAIGDLAAAERRGDRRTRTHALRAVAARVTRCRYPSASLLDELVAEWRKAGE